MLLGIYQCDCNFITCFKWKHPWLFLDLRWDAFLNFRLGRTTLSQGIYRPNANRIFQKTVQILNTHIILRFFKFKFKMNLTSLYNRNSTDLRWDAFFNFRFGHTTVPPGIYRRDRKCNFRKSSNGGMALRLCSTWWDSQVREIENQLGVILIDVDLNVFLQ